LMMPLRAAINKAKKDHAAARKDDVRVRRNGLTRTVNLEVIPLKNQRERCFLILFEDIGNGERTATGSPDLEPHGIAKATGPSRKNAEARQMALLESELAQTRDYLQSLQEQYEAAHEQLQGSNEEVQSANEELQSINEELETSKEELESTNEELITINEEMASRNIELNHLNNDLVNLQGATQLAIVLLGRDLNIRRFSAQAEKHFNLLVTDVGRPIANVRHNLDVPELESLITDVIASGREHERQVQDQVGRWYSLRIRPYLTTDHKVDGAVLVLVDIDSLKRSEREIAAERDYAEAIVRTVHDPLLILDADLRVHAANEAFYDTFKVAAAESEGRLIYELGDGQWNVPKLRELLEDILFRDSVFSGFEVTHDFKGLGPRTVMVNARTLRDTSDKPRRILLGMQDVTEMLRYEFESRESAERFKLLFDRSPLPKWAFNVETLAFIDVNDAAVKLYGYSRD
ncbi:MAG TPA: PAS domain-containing protein, partial [Pirellulaceae bacterium]